MGKVAIIGGGAWGTALAGVAARAGNSVSLWARDAQTVAEIAISIVAELIACRNLGPSPD